MIRAFDQMLKTIALIQSQHMHLTSIHFCKDKQFKFSFLFNWPRFENHKSKQRKGVIVTEKLHPDNNLSKKITSISS